MMRSNTRVLWVLAAASFLVIAVFCGACWGASSGIVHEELKEDVGRLSLDNRLMAAAVSGGGSSKGGWSDRFSRSRARSDPLLGLASSSRTARAARDLERADRWAGGVVNQYEADEGKKLLGFSRSRAAREAHVSLPLETLPHRSEGRSRGRYSPQRRQRLLRAVKHATERAMAIEQRQETQDTVKLARLVSGAGSNDHARLASEIVGLRNPDSKTRGELRLLQKDELVAKCLSSGAYKHGGC